MNLIGFLEKEHSKAQRDRIVAYIGDDPKRFADLVAAFLNGPYRITQRAAWPLSHCVKKHPHLVQRHLPSLINHLKKEGLHDAVARNTFRLMQFIKLPTKLHGRVADLCFKYLADRSRPIATRVFAMTVLTNLCEFHPELAQELTPLIEDELPLGSPAFRARGSKMLAQLKKIADRADQKRTEV